MKNHFLEKAFITELKKKNIEAIDIDIADNSNIMNYVFFKIKFNSPLVEGKDLFYYDYLYLRDNYVVENVINDIEIVLNSVFLELGDIFKSDSLSEDFIGNQIVKKRICLTKDFTIKFDRYAIARGLLSEYSYIHYLLPELDSFDIDKLIEKYC